ncbi:FAD dependent oxidoreductase [Pyronema omphalodes]|nr:FAD dependent oxidoreductase [Pyronema omphalodes]
MKLSHTSLLQRLNTAPGKPVASPTLSAWQTPAAPLANFSSEDFPTEVDVLIIGSGITACSIAYHLLQQDGPKPRIAIFEARELCSGATGRNGGHVKESAYNEWARLVERFGRIEADEVVRFRMAHLKNLLELAEKEGLTELAEARELETVDVYCEPEEWVKAQQRLREWLDAFPDEKGRWRTWEGADLQTKFNLTTACGCITSTAGALSSYTLITHLYQRLLTTYPSLSLHTNTPIETIQGTPVDAWRRPISPLQPYSVFTFTGSSATIKATHVVHATNGHITRLLPGLKGRIIAARAQMTSQRLLPEGASLPGESNRSWCFCWKKGLDYLTIRKNGTYMLGGGFARGPAEGLDALGNARDDQNTIYEAAYLGGLLPAIFPDAVKGTLLENAWTGTIGISVDALPWVGQVPEKVAGGRKRGTGMEWVCGAYSGEGMVNAWGCGRALAVMLRNQLYKENASTGLPKAMLITEKRVKKATVDMMVEDYLS